MVLLNALPLNTCGFVKGNRILSWCRKMDLMGLKSQQMGERVKQTSRRILMRKCEKRGVIAKLAALAVGIILSIAPLSTLARDSSNFSDPMLSDIRVNGEPVDLSFGQEVSLQSLAAVEHTFRALSYREMGETVQFSISLCDAVHSLNSLVENLRNVTLREDPRLASVLNPNDLNILAQIASVHGISWGYDSGVLYDRDGGGYVKMSRAVRLLELEAERFRDSIFLANEVPISSATGACDARMFGSVEAAIFPTVRPALVGYIFVSDMVSQLSVSTYRD